MPHHSPNVSRFQSLSHAVVHPTSSCRAAKPLRWIPCRCPSSPALRVPGARPGWQPRARWLPRGQRLPRRGPSPSVGFPARKATRLPQSH